MEGAREIVPVVLEWLLLEQLPVVVVLGTLRSMWLAMWLLELTLGSLLEQWQPLMLLVLVEREPLLVAHPVLWHIQEHLMGLWP